MGSVWAFQSHFTAYKILEKIFLGAVAKALEDEAGSCQSQRVSGSSWDTVTPWLYTGCRWGICIPENLSRLSLPGSFKTKLSSPSWINTPCVG